MSRRLRTPALPPLRTSLLRLPSDSPNPSFPPPHAVQTHARQQAHIHQTVFPSASRPLTATPRAALPCSRAGAGDSHRKSSVDASEPRSCARVNGRISVGRIPANVSLSDLANVTAGLANDVEAVNQYAAAM